MQTFTFKPLALAWLALASLASTSSTLNASEQKQLTEQIQLTKIADTLKEPEQKQQVESKETVAKRMTSQNIVTPQSIIFKGHTAPVVALTQVSTTPVVFASADAMGAIKLWSLEGYCFTTITPKKETPIKAITALSASQIATLACPHKQGIWELQESNGTIMATMVNIDKDIPTSECIVTIWDLTKKEPLIVAQSNRKQKAKNPNRVHEWIPMESHETINSNKITPRISGFLSGYKKTWDTKSCTPDKRSSFSIVTPFQLPINSKVTAYAWLDDQRKVATGWPNGTIRIWENGTTNEKTGTYVLEGSQIGVTALAKLSNDLLAAGYENGTILVWNLTTRKANIYPGHVKAVRALLPLSPTSFISGSDDMTIRVWNLNASAVTQAQAARKEKEADVALHKNTEPLNKTGSPDRHPHKD